MLTSALVLLQEDNDPHHVPANFNYFYLFLTLSPILVLIVAYVGLKLGDRWEKGRRARRRTEREDHKSDHDGTDEYE